MTLRRRAVDGGSGVTPASASDLLIVANPGKLLPGEMHPPPELPRNEELGQRSHFGSDRLALWAFITGEVGCFSAFVWLARFEWFVGDEWDFLSTRTVGNLNELFTPHNQHWSTLPILEYRLLWQLVGLRSYFPYLIVVVTLHLTVATLLRVVMRRAGVSPWIATVAALVFALFGAGYDNIVFAFQSGYDGSLVFGFTSLLLADHEGRFNRRDIFAMLAGLASLMCSGVGVTMVIVVATAVLLRRGAGPALAHAAPLAALYLVWLALVGHKGYDTSYSTPSEVVRFATSNLTSTFSSIGHLPGMGLALAVILVIGVWAAWFRLAETERRRRFAAPGALLIGSLVFVVITGIGRAAPVVGLFRSLQTNQANPHYIGVAAALVLPALAVAADAVIHRWALLTPVVLLALVIGIPGNVNILAKGVGTQAQFSAYRNFILSLPRLAVAKEVPPSIHPDPSFDPYLTMGWLRAGVASGRIPAPGPVSQEDRANWTLSLALEPTSHPAMGVCTQVTLPAILHLNRDETITFSSPVSLTYLAGNGVTSAPHSFGWFGPTTYVVYEGLSVSAEPARHAEAVAVCKPND